MTDLTDYVDRGALRPIVDRVYPLEDIALAQHSVETGGGRGKRVLRYISG
jgi:NADPH:quinone reductase-like Zn-dependent oxidoreductase